MADELTFELTFPNMPAPDSSDIRFLVGATEGATKASLVEVTIAAGKTSKPVKHRTVEEI